MKGKGESDPGIRKHIRAIGCMGGRWDIFPWIGRTEETVIDMTKTRTLLRSRLFMWLHALDHLLIFVNQCYLGEVEYFDQA